MATNPYVSINDRGHEGEWRLRESLAAESIQFEGTDLVYIPRKWVTTDDILQEIVMSRFDRGYVIEGVISGMEQLVENAFMLNNLNIMGLTTIEVTIAKARFAEEVPADALQIPGRPNEGDLIFVPMTRALLEIRFAEPDNLMVSGGHLHVYKLKCEFFRSSAEKMPDEVESALAELDGLPEVLLKDSIVRDPSDDDIVDYTKISSNDVIDEQISQYIKPDAR